jgi:hypothetical protein
MGAHCVCQLFRVHAAVRTYLQVIQNSNDIQGFFGQHRMSDKIEGGISTPTQNRLGMNIRTERMAYVASCVPPSEAEETNKEGKKIVIKGNEE